MFALAQKCRLGFFGLEDDGGESLVRLVRAITERLIVRVSTGTPGVGLSRFQFHFSGLFSGNMGFRHLGLLDGFSLKKSNLYVFHHKNHPFKETMT
jgi:hypothetical protein